jgi:hypothetical protein
VPSAASLLDRESALSGIILSPDGTAGQTTSTTYVWSIPGAIDNGIKRTGANGQGLEPDEGQCSCPVLRGLGGGNIPWLPGGLMRRAVEPSRGSLARGWELSTCPALIFYAVVSMLTTTTGLPSARMHWIMCAVPGDLWSQNATSTSPAWAIW